jgi:hypothetical protein
MICKSINLGVSGSCVKAAADLVTKQLTAESGRPAATALESDSAVWFEENGAITSFLVWREWEEENALFIVLAWTEPKRRSQGRYRKLFNLVKEDAKRMGISRLIRGIAPTDTLSREVHEGMGMKPVMFEVTV